MKNIALAGWTALASLTATTAFADQPVAWQARFQDAATPIMEEITWFEHYTLWFIIPITLFVLALLIYVGYRFRASANPEPSRTSHNTLIEIIWTVAPVVILLFIAIPSFQLLAAQYEAPEDAALTIKATGYQWYWGYEYQTGTPVSGTAGEGEPTEIAFDSIIVNSDEARAEAGKEDLSVYPRLLTVDNEIVVPVNQPVRLLVTAADVIHSFAMPAFGIKLDAIPGRLNETFFQVEREGLYYGQCSELCGKDHAFMPIAIRAVSQEQYDTWLQAAAEDVGAANQDLMAAVEAKKAVDVAENVK